MSLIPGRAVCELVASAGGTTKESSIWQTIAPALSTSQQYTLSFWFLANPSQPRSVTVRLSGSGIVASTSGSLFTQLTRAKLESTPLRSWHIRHAIESKKQLLEVLLQFLENHFVTEYSKSRDYFDQFYNGADIGQLATRNGVPRNPTLAAGPPQPGLHAFMICSRSAPKARP